MKLPFHNLEKMSVYKNSARICASLLFTYSYLIFIGYAPRTLINVNNEQIDIKISDVIMRTGLFVPCQTR